MLTAVATLIHQLSAPLELSEVISTVLAHAVEVLPMAAGILRLLGPSGITVSTVAGYGVRPSPLDTSMIPVAQAPLDQSVLATQQPRALTESDPDAGELFPAAVRREGFRSALAVPLATPQAVLGVLHLYSNGLRRFYPEEIACIEEVASLGASALAQAKHYEALKVYVDVCRETHRRWTKPLPR